MHVSPAKQLPITQYLGQLVSLVLKIEIAYSNLLAQVIAEVVAKSAVGTQALTS